MYETYVKQAIIEIKRKFCPQPLKRYYLGIHNGHRVFIRESTLKHPYYDFSKGFSDIEKPSKKPCRKYQSNHPWEPDSMLGELLWWLWCTFWDIASGPKY